MKKTAVLIIAVILSVFCSVSAFAAETVEEKTINVFAKAVYTLPDGCFGAEEDTDGNYIAELPDGTKITLTPKSADHSLSVIIVPITEKDEQAYKWISGCAAGFGTDPLFYDIYFIDEYGNRVDVNMTLDVSIDLANSYKTLKAAEISADGSLSHLVSESGGNKISFIIEKGEYYAIASSKSGIFPDTGDKIMIDFWIALLIVSVIGAAGTVIYIKKKNSFIK